MLGAAATAAGTAIVTGLVTSGLRAIDEQAKLARALDGTIDGLRGLQIAAGDAGVSSGDLESSLRNLNTRLGEAMDGSGAAADAIERLGLSAAEVNALDVDERVAVFADRIADMGLSAAETANVLRDFGVRSQDMINLMRQGGDAIRDARQEVDDFGLSLSEVDAAQIEVANDALSRVYRAGEAIRNQITIALAPVITLVADLFNDAAREAQGWGDQAYRGAQIAIQALGRVLEAIGQVVSFIEDHPQIGQFGLIGYALFGRRGAAVGALAGTVSEAAQEAIAQMSGGTTRSFNEIDQQLMQLEGRIGEIRRTGETGSFFGGNPEAEIQRLQEETRRLYQLQEDLVSSEALPGEAFSDTVERLQEASEEASNFGDTMSDVGRRLSEGFSDEAIEAARERAREAAEDIAASRDMALGIDGEGDERHAQAMSLDEQRDLERHQAELDRLEQHLMNERELEEHQHNDRLARLRQALDAGATTEDQYRSMREQLTAQHEDRITEMTRQAEQERTRIKEQEANAQRAMQQRYAGEMSSLIGQIFQQSKAAAIAQALINTYQGVTRTLAAYPYPFNIPLAAAHAAAGFAQIANIRSTSQSGGGGGSRSVTGGGGSSAAASAGGGGGGSGGGQGEGGAGPMLVQLSGISPEALMSTQMVSTLFEKLSDEAGDRGLRVVGSR